VVGCCFLRTHPLCCYRQGPASNVHSPERQYGLELHHNCTYSHLDEQSAMHDIRQFHTGRACQESVPNLHPPHPTTCSSNGLETFERKAPSLVQTPIKKRRSTFVNPTYGRFGNLD